MQKKVRIDDKDRKQFVEENIESFSRFVRSTIDRRMNGGDPFYVTVDFLLWLMVFTAGLFTAFISIFAGIITSNIITYSTILFIGVTASTIGVFKIRKTVNKWRTIYP